MGSARTPIDVAAQGYDGRPVPVAGDDAANATLACRSTARFPNWWLLTLELFTSSNADENAVIGFFDKDDVLLAAMPVVVAEGKRPYVYLSGFQMRAGLAVKVWATNPGVVFFKPTLEKLELPS